MGKSASEQTRSKSGNGNATQFDRDLIVAARDDKEVHLYFSLDSVLRGEADMECQVEVVDRYMLKVSDMNSSNKPFWIQKHLLAGVRVL